MSDVLGILRKKDPPLSIIAALDHLEMILSRGQVHEGIPGLAEDLPDQIVRMFIFQESSSRSSHHSKRPSAIQELQVLQVLLDYFHSQENDMKRHNMFRLLFDSHLTKSRRTMLYKLISMAIAVKHPNLLDCCAVWMQRQGCGTETSMQLAETIVEDYCILVPGAMETMKQLPQLSPHFTCNFLTAVTLVYQPNGTVGSQKQVPVDLLELVTTWMESDPSLCLISINKAHSSAFMQLHRSSLWTSPTKSNTLTPFPGLLRWCTQAPLLSLTTKKKSPQSISKAQDNVSIDAHKSHALWSKLHLTVLQALVAFPTMPGANQLELVTLADMNRVVKEAVRMSKNIAGADDLEALSHFIQKSEGVEGDTDTAVLVSMAIDRLGQVLQVSLKTGGFRCSLGDLQSICNSLPRTRLMDLIQIQHLSRTPPPMHYETR